MIQTVMIACLWFGCPPPPPEPPKPVVQKVYSGMGTNVEQWRGLVESYFGAQTNNALCVMTHESGGNPNAISPTTDYGLMQIHAPLWAEPYGVSYQDLLDPVTNIAIAWEIYKDWGWSAWSGWSKC